MPSREPSSAAQQGPRVLVTGASGLLGGAVCAAFASAGYRVLGTYRNHAALVGTRPGVESVACDLTDRAALLALAERARFEVIVHTAALTDVEHCERVPDDAYRSNVLATRNVAQLARQQDAFMLYVSTASVFDGARGDYREHDTPRPCNFYSWTKLLGEEAALGIASALVLRATIVGRHPRRTQALNFLEWLAARLQSDQDLRLFDDVFINPLLVETLAGAIVQLASQRQRERGLILHAGTLRACSKAELGHQLQAHCFPDYAGKIEYVSADDAALSAPRAKQMWLNVDTIQAAGIAMPSLEQELARMLATIGHASRMEA